MVRLGRLVGADSLWTTDHFLGFLPQSIWDREFTWLASPGSSPDEYYDYQVLLGHLATRVGDRQLAVGVTEPIRRHPVLIAQMAMTLSHLTKRPPILGIGAGERENIEPYGLDFTSPVSVLEEALQVIRLCFEARGPVDFAGDHFVLEQALMDLRPTPDRTPEIWIAAHGPRMLRLTGRFGDGWYPTFPMGPEEYAAKLAVVRAAATEAGRDPDGIVPSLQSFFISARTEREARGLLDSRPARFAALLAGDEVWQRQGLTHPLGAGFRGMVDFVPQHYDRDTMYDLIDAVPPEVMAREALWGTPETIVAKIRALAEAGLRHVVLAPLGAVVSKRHAVTSIRHLISITRRLRSGR
jgi:phthiodiolone/phenolphthiodiolone dimycocerosates ketoreductase